jgi:hypothetical protein
MGKKTDKAGKADKSGKTAKLLKAGKLPKAIAGVKLPKEARAAGERLIAHARSPEGLKAIAAGLSVAATAAAAAAERRAARGAAGATPPPANDPASPQPRPGQPGIADPQALGTMVGEMADAFVKGLFARR